jgi:Ca2+-binding RTX toxin-like protein
VLLCAAALAGAPTAHAKLTLAYTDGNVATFTGDAADDELDPPVETNAIVCGEHVAPCMIVDTFFDSVTVPPDRCIESFSGSTSRCDVPSRIVADTGAGDDKVWLYDVNIPIEVHTGPGDDRVRGSDGNDRIYGDDGDDDLIGGPGDDIVDGGGGDDKLDSEIEGNGGEGADTWIGGPGIDHLPYWNSESGVSVSLDGVANDGMPGEGDNVSSTIEFLYGSEDDDTLIGDDNDNALHGMGGDDVIEGRGGDDLLLGDEAKSGLSISGNDRLSGGPGEDQIFGIGGDDVLDGGPGQDKMIADELCIYIANTPSCQWSVPGNDTISARDGEVDEIECGGGTDSAVVDVMDSVTDVFATFHNQCEQIDRPVTETNEPTTTPQSDATTPQTAATTQGTAAAPGRAATPSKACIAAQSTLAKAKAKTKTATKAAKKRATETTRAPDGVRLAHATRPRGMGRLMRTPTRRCAVSSVRSRDGKR